QELGCCGSATNRRLAPSSRQPSTVNRQLALARAARGRRQRVPARAARGRPSTSAILIEGGLMHHESRAVRYYGCLALLAVNRQLSTVNWPSRAQRAAGRSTLAPCTST